MNPRTSSLGISYVKKLYSSCSHYSCALKLFEKSHSMNVLLEYLNACIEHFCNNILKNILSECTKLFKHIPNVLLQSINLI